MSRNTSDVVTPANPPAFPQEAFAPSLPQPRMAASGLSKSESQLSPKVDTAALSEIQVRVQQLEQGDWQLWTAAIGVPLLLMGAVLSLSLSPLWQQGSLVPFPLNGIAAALFSMVLVFCAYVVYQQIGAKRARGGLSQEIDALLLSQHVDSVFNLQFRTEDSYQLAMLDPVTGLYNRQFLEKHLSTELARSNGNSHSPTVVALDLKNFQQITDDYGSWAGDLVLKQFSAQLKKAIRSSDVAARTDSDDFLVLFPECKPDQVPTALLRLTDLDVDFRGQKIPVGFTASWTTYQPGDTPGELLDRAEKAVRSGMQTGSAEQEIQEAQAQVLQLKSMEALGRLAGGVAHDMNNLLTLVKGYSELAMDRLGRTDPARSYVEQILRAIERVNSLIWQLLAFSRRQALNPELLDLNELLADMEPRLSRLVSDQTELALAPGQPVGQIRADRRQVQQVILNLALNARDAMPHGGKLALETADVELSEEFARSHRGAQPGHYVLLEVTDTGLGMDGETLSHLFEPFFTTKERGKGTGLGLSTAYGIIKQSGGYIWVTSEPGQGTTFRIYLPRVEQAEEESAEPNLS